jgi:hypothetical protein
MQAMTPAQISGFCTVYDGDSLDRILSKTGQIAYFSTDSKSVWLGKLGASRHFGTHPGF